MATELISDTLLPSTGYNGNFISFSSEKSLFSARRHILAHFFMDEKFYL